MGGAPSFDLQCHSTRSDGTLEPAAVVALYDFELAIGPIGSVVA